MRAYSGSMASRHAEPLALLYTQALLNTVTGDPNWAGSLKSAIVWSTLGSGFVVCTGIHSVSLHLPGQQ